MKKIPAHFELCSPEEVPNYPYPEHPLLPRRGTSRSAGYDFYCPYAVSIPPHQRVFVPTFVKCLDMPEDKVLMIFIRSSLALKRGLSLANGTGIIDSDYVWGIGINLVNQSDETQTIEAGERFAQGIFLDYFVEEGDEPLSSTREGGYGSTGKK